MNRRGSALLIVLGFLSFMVVSAVAFSIYMRSERVPSSVFRKNAAVRQLVKAGLAHAISELDNVIRDDPFPGLIRNPNASGAFRKYMQQANKNLPVDPPYEGLDGNRRYIDWWYGRVFMPPNPDDEKDGSLFAPEDETVSVVTLEGLGYVPPPLINDVRILSRGSWAAKWRSFDYAVGRYAYCAVNVSDYFDINRMSIAEPRTGFNRVSLAALFTKNDTSMDVDAGKAEALANFVASPGSGNNGAQSAWPLVSMLDYALANESSSRNGFSSHPFYQWIDNTTQRRPIYQNTTDDARRQIFVTDSWYPPSYKEGTRPTLDMDATGNQRGQPFDLNTFNDLAMTPQPLATLLNASFPDATGENGVRFNDMLSGTEIVALYDYLDRDDIPSSLALPTVERNPMVVAISPQVRELELKVPATALTQATALNPTPPPTPVNFDPAGFNEIANRGLQVILAYPFKHGNFSGMNLDSASYQVQAVAKIFLVDKSKTIGTRGKAFGGNYNNAVFRPSDPDYTDNSKVDNNVITLVARPENVSFSGGNDLTKEIGLRFKPISGDITVAEHKSEWITPPPVGGVPQPGQAVSTWTIKFFPIDVNGNQVTPPGYSANAPTLPTDQNGYVAVMAVWVRVKDDRGFVADCVPATFYEDSFNGLQQNSNLKSALTMQDACGDGEPLLRFTVENGAEEFQYSGIVNGAATGPFTTTTQYGRKQNWRQKTIWAVDPRYNHAPEDWCMETGSELSRQEWENKALNAADRSTGGDGEIYLAVSNQGFLQSMGELAFLPRVKDHFSDSYTSGGKMWGVRWANKRGAAYRSGIDEYPTSPSGDLLDMVWRTYEPWDNETNGDNLFGCGIAEHPGYGCVNPYSDNTRVLMTALANTPVNWLVAAGTNTVKDASRGQNTGDTIAKRRNNLRTLQDGLKFAYNETGSAASEDRELKFAALQRLANGMSNAFREGVKDGKKWETIYDEWDWTPTGTPFSWAGSDFTDQLDSIDCRFLHSFWRGCFANRQQLFLVFVRAESMALGGSGEGQIPPQQGGRAVALVWRDPEMPNGGNDAAQIDSTSYRPHRTRILFYHQFD